ncbi:TIGR04283 family arsenosugar biosynthesis glycosyltransferase [Sulfitobacter aestuarii]|uniref:TIGR04283 family arsenosugar biosynthesis glycosyltransferase n=1 Tax=Sulfitobacter aestuarii TaxID=2161676 RepID=A0ABW5U033_9RHOB
MRAPISVIIPTLDAAGELPQCLAALVEGLECGLVRELIVSDGGSGDATREIVERWGGEWREGAASRGGQLRRGCAAARGDWLLVLHADTVLAPGWSQDVAAHLARGTAACFRLRFDASSPAARLVAGWANLRSRLGLPYGDQGLLLPRSLYESIGGFPDQPLMEDVALVRALHGQITLLRAEAVTSAEKYRRQGWLRRGGRNLLTLLRYFTGTAPETLARAYRRQE